MNKLLIALIIFIHISFQTYAQTAPEALSIDLSSELPFNSDVKKGVLENGLTYYIKKNSKPEKRVELRLVVKAGSILEDDSQVGLAHFVEHMCFNGTKNFPKNELVSYLQSVGVKFGAELNAYTSFDKTVYILPIPVDEEILDEGLKILNDWAFHVSFDSVEIEKERGIVIEEWRMGRGASQRMRDKSLPVLLKGSKYAERLPIGTLENLESFKQQDLKRFYKEWYRPDLMAVIAVGDIDVEVMEKKITEIFGAKEYGEILNIAEYPIPDHEETLISIATDKEAPFTSVQLYIKNDLSPEVTVEDYRAKLLNYFYTGMLNLRLQEILQNPNPPFLYAGCNFGIFIDHKTAYSSYANVKENGILEGLKALLIENERVQRHGFTTGELDRFKKNIVKLYERAYNERDKSPSSSLAEELIRNFLEDEPVPGIEFEYSFIKTHIDGISLDEINALSEKLLRADNRVVLVNAPEKEDLPIPTEEDIRKVIGEVSAQHVAPYVDKLSGLTLIEKLPVPGSIVDEHKINAINVTELTLSNGAKVILKPTDFKNDEILLTAWSPGGHSLSTDENYFSASNADVVVNECGIGGFSPVDLQKILAGKTANARSYISMLEEGITANATPQDIETMFQLIYLSFTAPNRSQDLFDSFISRNKEMLKNIFSNPTYYFYNARNKVLGQNHLRSNRIFEEDEWDKINLDSAVNFYKNRFADAGDFTFVLVGNFNVETLKPLLAQYIGSLPSSGRIETWIDRGIRYPEGRIDTSFHKGSDQKSNVSIVLHDTYKYDKDVNYLLKSFTDVLNIKLIEVLREEKSGVYGVGASFSASKWPYENFTLSISYPCKPENIDSLNTAAFDIIKNIKNKGVSDEDIQKVKESQLKEFEVRIKENGYWLSALKHAYLYGYNPEEIVTYEKKVENLNNKNIQETANTYIDFKNCIILKLLPETK